MAENIVPLKQRRVEAPALQCVELRLGESYEIELTLRDQAGGVVLLTYALQDKSPKDFDMAVLRQSWDHWRERSDLVAS